MKITIGDDLDLAVATGTSVLEIAAAARSLGVPLGSSVWCGDIALDPRHSAGTWPLLEGARLTPDPGLPCAPPRGRTLLVIAGPQSGRRAFVGPKGTIVGRGEGADLSLADPAVSRTHAAVQAGPALAVSDLGSCNGTTVWRGGSPHAIGRSRELKGGDILSVGSSLVAVLDDDGTEAVEPCPTIDPTPQASDPASRLAPLAGSVISGIMVAAMTGRWYLAALGLAYPAYLAHSLGLIRPRRRRLPWDLAALPSLLSTSRRAWSTDPPRSIAVLGRPEPARAFARALALTLGFRLRADGWHEPWMDWLPDAPPGGLEVAFVIEGPAPSWCDARAEIRSDGGILWLKGKVSRLPPLGLAEAEAEALARSLAGASGRGSLPRRVRWADVASPPASPEQNRTLRVPLGMTASGPYVLDLDAHGPHVLVAGTTGSGKSALLETLILGLTLRHSPDDLGVALIDFKGGAGVRTCADLPHVRGLLTDLDPHLARRALKALSRELSDRKGALAEKGLSSFREWETSGGAPPRLLVVADEYQEVAAQYRDFLPDLARLAAQGRSLGLHLILATQRPAGAVTPEIRANMGTTFALRVVTDSESRDLVGTSDVAEFPADVPGRAMAVTGTQRTTLQVALPCVVPTPRIRCWGEEDDLSVAARDMAASAIRRWSGHARAAPLWLDPLPHDLGEAANPTVETSNRPPGLWLGRGDVPSERRQPDVRWDPRSGLLLITGPPRSGRTTALKLIAAQARSEGFRPVWLPSDPREAARTILLCPRTPNALLLVDDAQRALTLLADVDRGAPVDHLIALAYSGAPLAVALPKAGAQRLASHAVAFLVFAGGDAIDDAAWPMPRELHGLAPLPGRARFGAEGRWCEIQVGRESARLDEPLVNPLPLRVNPADLPRGDGLVIGVGGDRAGPLAVDPSRPVLLVSPPGPTREAVEASLRACASREGLSLDLESIESPLARARGFRDEGTIIMAEPTERLARECYRGELDGLIDPRPPIRRVLVIRDGSALAAQLVEAPGAHDSP
ncbi:MAG: FHA domain-containing protein [Demequinaceae bacterium]|nr:FHA domain-containing protein [Demequinaceae bacterium]